MDNQLDMYHSESDYMSAEESPGSQHLSPRRGTPSQTGASSSKVSPPADCQQGDKGKGRDKYSHDDPEPSMPTGPCPLISLPPELIDSILSYLSPIALTRCSATCRLLHTHATADRVWQSLVQSHVPGLRVTSPYPFTAFRDLFRAHDPNWFVPRNKIWFSDGDLAGRLIVTRYDQRRGCIEGYQLVAVSNRQTLQPWPADNGVMIHGFEPEVKLHLDKPVLHLSPLRTDPPTEEITTVGGITLVRINADAASVSRNLQGEAATSSSSPTDDQRGETRRRENRFQAEIPMSVGSIDATNSAFMLARPIDDAEVSERSRKPFPYAYLWPPPAIPAHHRVAGASHNNFMDLALFRSEKPTSRHEVSDQVFRIRKWLQMRLPAGGGLNGILPTPGNRAWTELPLNGAALLSRILPTPLGLNVGEEVSTYATLDPALYTPTPEKPYRGIWVGDYATHGCEFILMHQPDDGGDGPEEDGGRFDPESITRRDGETEEQFVKRRHDETVYRGRLEGIKLTGDPNVPRGERTFVAQDIGDKGFVAVVQHEPFAGTRVVRSEGHIAHTGFSDDQWIESQLLLISHNRLAQYWIGFGHISFFERVDIDKFLVPE